MSERRFGGYALRRLLGRGASASVVEATAPDGRRVALKVPHPHVQDDALEREAARAMAVSSPHVVRVEGVVREGRDRALVLELVLGETLAARLERGAFALDEAHRLAHELSAGLAAIHGAAADGVALGLVHGDVSPANVLLDEHGRAKLTDLGLARRRALTALSQSGGIHGSVGYVAPEVIRGRPSTPRADVFALGVVLHEAITGRRAFEGRTDLERLRATVEVTLAAIDGPLGSWIQRCTHKRPEARPTDGAAAMAALVRH
ncbi:MAG: serine/threonine protein kinase [Myxococcales bacterium]|nr:serine/threonine protein kinase [Myxococcales bacterium]